jgi:hypothetical protein
MGLAFSIWLSASTHSYCSSLERQIEVMKMQEIERNYIESLVTDPDGTQTLTRSYFDDIESDAQVLEEHAAGLRDGGEVKCTTWTSGGVQHTVKTTRAENETETEWCARHDSRVAAAKEMFPPDEGGR